MEWLFCAVQVQVAVSQSATQGLPPELLTLYKALRVFSFEGLGPPPACLPNGVFQSQLAFFTIVTIAGCALLLLSWAQHTAHVYSACSHGTTASAVRRAMQCATVTLSRAVAAPSPLKASAPSLLPHHHKHRTAHRPQQLQGQHQQL